MTTIDFTADGNARCLHTDDIPLQSIGTLTVRRASRVEFNERLQLWEVYKAEGHWRETNRRLFASESRLDAILWERKHWEKFV